MAGPLTIQRVPRGLLDALMMKGSGSNPVNLADEIRATFPVEAFYLQETRKILTSALLPAAAGGYQSNNGWTVPSGEMWVVNTLTISTSPGAGVSGEMALGYASSTAGTLDSFCLAPYVVCPASNTSSQGMTFVFGDLVLLPNYSVGYWTRAIVGAFQGSMRADVYRLLL